MRRIRHSISFLLTLPVFAGACSGEFTPVSYQDQPVAQAIDMHLHTGKWSLLPPRTQAYLASRFPFPLGLAPESLVDRTLSSTGILEQLDDAGLEKAVLFAVYAPESVGVTKNQFMIDTIEEAPERLFGFASVAVENWDADEEDWLVDLETALQHPQVLGIKLAHAHQHFEFDDERFYSIYALAGELNTPVYLHTGPSPFPGTVSEPEFTDPSFLEEAVEAFPETVFILGHLGHDFINLNEGQLEACIDLAKRYPNIYLEPSAMGSSGADPTGELYPHALRRIREEGLVDRLIYGSDGPQYPGFVSNYLERTLVAMEKANYSHEEATAVLSLNFQRLFGLTP